MIQEFIGTGYVLNPSHTKILLIHHKKFDKWLPPGGHCDDNETPHEAAKREVFEETGINAYFVEPNKLGLDPNNKLEEQLPTPLFILKEFIEGKYGKGGKGEDHYHIDFIYIMEADEKDLVINEHEIMDASWFGKEELVTLITFPGVSKIANKILH